MKKTRFLTLILAFALCASVLVLTACGDNDSEKEEQIKKEYWSIDSTFFTNDDIYLTKTVTDGDGNPLTVYNYNKNTREEFHYKDGKLEYSETFEIFDIVKLYVSYQYTEEKRYETRYVYEGDKIVRGEIFYNGAPTQSYDEYEYAADGSLKSVKCYDLGRLISTYNYNGSLRPESYENNYRKYIFEYDEAGNLKKCSEFKEDGSENQYIAIEYSNGAPVKSAKMTAEEEIEVSYKYHENGNFKETAYGYKKISDGKTVSSKLYTIDYNELGLITAKYTDHGKTETSVEASYNDSGNLCEIKYFNGKGEVSTTIKVEYGENGVVKSKKYYDGSSSYVFHVCEYDESGRPIKEVECDKNGTVISEDLFEYYPSGVRKRKTSTSFGMTSVMTYAENGNLIRSEGEEDSYIEYIDSEMSYKFSRDMGLLNLSLDMAGSQRRKIVIGGRVTEEYEYHENYNVKKNTTYKEDGSYSVLEYDDLGRRTKLTEYDAAGNVIKEEIYDK